MPYETSYDIGLKPFNHDKRRGKWASPMDFFFTCIGHAFKIDAIFVLPSVIFRDFGFYALINYFIIMLVCTIPIVFMQSFLGQFSSTGFISVLRIAPLFKGIGYVSLAINITTLAYYSIFGAIPLFYFLNSLRPTLPWSCEGLEDWFDLVEKKMVHCNQTSNIELDQRGYTAVELPSLDFFTKHLNIVEWHHRGKRPEITYSWSLILCTCVIWTIVWTVLRKPTEMVGRILRYSTLTMLAILLICFLRLIFLPGAITGLINFFKQPVLKSTHIESFFKMPIMALSGLGPGWGSILTMASYNNFKTDITKYTWILCLGQFGLMMVTSFSWIFIENFLKSPNPDKFYLHRGDSLWMQFLSLPTALSLLEMPNFWSLLFFGMLTLGATNLLIVQLFSVLTSLFDEYEQLRPFKKEVIRITTGVLALVSILFCSNYGVFAFEYTANFSVLTQIFINLMLLLVVLWVYGRERFQRDLQFMTSRTYYTWMVYVVRFVAPIVLLISFVISIAMIAFEGKFTLVLFIVVTIVVLLPWFLIPGYCIFKIMQTSGLLKMRFKRCVRPTDWYPADPVDRQRYEETFSNPEISHQLTTTAGDDV